MPLSYLLNLDGKGIRYRLTRKGVAERGEPEIYHIAGALKPHACRSASSFPCCLCEPLAGVADASAILPPFRPLASTGTNATIMDSVFVDFDVLGSDWRLEAIPLEGWYPVWLEPLYLVVVIAAILASASTLLILKARWQHYHLLLRMLPKRVRGCWRAAQPIGRSALPLPPHPSSVL